jgi:hypothetical protein
LEAKWKEQKNEQVATLYNQIVELTVENKAHIDEMIIALELALQEALNAKLRIINEQRNLSDVPPTEVEG